MQDVVDVHEVQEDLLLQRSLSMSKQNREAADFAQLDRYSPDLDIIGEEHEKGSAGLSDDDVPTLATQLPGDVQEEPEHEHTSGRPASREASAPIPIDKLEDVSTDDWGLDMLVRVGESWAPNLLLMTPCAPQSHDESVRA